MTYGGDKSETKGDALSKLTVGGCPKRNDSMAWVTFSLSQRATCHILSGRKKSTSLFEATVGL